MTEIAKPHSIAEIVNECIAKRETDWFDLWWVVGRIEQRFPTESHAEIKRLVLEAVRLLVERGFHAGGWSEPGYRFWPEKDVDAIIVRISRECVVDGKEPHWLRSICLFGEFEMDEAAKQAVVAKLSAAYCAHRGWDQEYLGMIASGIRWDCGIKNNEEVKRLTLEAVRALAGCGFRFGTLRFYGDTDLIPWPEQDADSVVARIDREWDPKGGDPTLKDPICWFE